METRKPFPIPVRAIEGLLGPGSHAEDDVLEYIDMPKDMSTYRPPVIPDDVLRDQSAAGGYLHQALTLAQNYQGVSQIISLKDADIKTRNVINQVFGEGEVAAKFETPTFKIHAQESVFAGIWRVVHMSGFGDSWHLADDYIEIASFPECLIDLEDGVDLDQMVANFTWPAEVMNAPTLMEEMREQIALDRAQGRVREQAYIINLTLLPLSPEDVGVMDALLGDSQVTILSRGYGNCRITRCAVAGVWRVVYYNSQDSMILNTIEIVRIPSVACASAEDLHDSAERLTEVLAWLESQ